MKYVIRYRHTSQEAARNIREALWSVKQQARQDRLYYAESDDGLYCYKTKSDKDRDDTGESAFAVICSTQVDENASQH